MTNDILENALKEIWEMKDKFYEDNKNLSVKEIIEKIENKKYNIYAGQSGVPSTCDFAEPQPRD
jgi:hypothetical protein